MYVWARHLDLTRTALDHLVHGERDGDAGQGSDGARLARWLYVGALVVRIGLRMAALFTRPVLSNWRASVGELPPMRQQLLDLAVQLRRQSREHVLQISPWLVAVELGRLQQAHHHRGPLAGQLAADEQPVAPLMLLCS